MTDIEEKKEKQPPKSRQVKMKAEKPKKTAVKNKETAKNPIFPKIESTMWKGRIKVYFCPECSYQNENRDHVVIHLVSSHFDKAKKNQAFKFYINNKEV